ncbi:DMT family transporter [Fusobacterium sp. PH5-44]|uniref:DMT family transporter n=1 Tax=unclassified Fusobacterium TaxID=2648384 RepID=UPI003D1E6862
MIETRIVSKKEKIAILEAFVGYGIFGFSFLFSKRVLAFTDEYVLLGLRFLLVFIIMNILLLTGKVRVNFKDKPIGYLLLLGTLQPVIYFSCEIGGIKLVDTSLVGILIALTPILSMVMGIIVLNEKVNIIQKLSVLASVFGVILTTAGQFGSNFSIKGLLYILCAVMAASMYNLISRKSANSFSAFEMTYVMFAIGFVYFSFRAFIRIDGNYSEKLLLPLQNKDLWIALIYLSCISSVGAFMLINHAVSYLSVSKISVFANVTTVISILAGVFILKENFNLYQVIGSIIIILGVYGANREK